MRIRLNGYRLRTVKLQQRGRGNDCLLDTVYGRLMLRTNSDKFTCFLTIIGERLETSCCRCQVRNSNDSETRPSQDMYWRPTRLVEGSGQYPERHQARERRPRSLGCVRLELDSKMIASTICLSGLLKRNSSTGIRIFSSNESTVSPGSRLRVLSLYLESRKLLLQTSFLKAIPLRYRVLFFRGGYSPREN